MTVRVKICGIRTKEEALAVAMEGPSELGFHVELLGARSPLTSEQAAEIIAALPRTIASVMVTSATEPAKLVQLLQTTQADIAQLCGDVTSQTIRELKKVLPKLEVWKVIKVADGSAIDEARQYAGVADALILDTAKGGSGKTHDWTISKKIRESVSTPIILAGGLNPENVADAIRLVHPYSVDVNSGVSNSDGSKDIEKVKAFIEGVEGIR